MAQLFHSPVHRGPASDPQRGEQLPGRSHFPGASLSKWLGEQIQSQLTTLLPVPPAAVLEAMAEVQTALADPARSRGTTLDAIFTLHCRLLEALTIADYRLGKGYGLGRAMAETALLPAGADSGEERKQKFNSMLADGRAIAIRDCRRGTACGHTRRCHPALSRCGRTAQQAGTRRPAAA